jgi:hypothetical protein
MEEKIRNIIATIVLSFLILPVCCTVLSGESWNMEVLNKIPAAFNQSAWNASCILVHDEKAYYGLASTMAYVDFSDEEATSGLYHDWEVPAYDGILMMHGEYLVTTQQITYRRYRICFIDFEQSRVVRSLEVEGRIYCLGIKNDVLAVYSSFGGDYFGLYDVSNVEEGINLLWEGHDSFRKFCIEGNDLFVFDSDNELYWYDIENPSEPERLASLGRYPCTIYKIMRSGDLLFTATNAGFYIDRITRRGRIERISVFWDALVTNLAIEGNKLALWDGRMDSQRTLRIYDITDPSDFQLIQHFGGLYNNQTQLKDIQWEDNYLYVYIPWDVNAQIARFAFNEDDGEYYRDKYFLLNPGSIGLCRWDDKLALGFFDKVNVYNYSPGVELSTYASTFTFWGAIEFRDIQKYGDYLIMSKDYIEWEVQYAGGIAVYSISADTDTLELISENNRLGSPGHRLHIIDETALIVDLVPHHLHHKWLTVDLSDLEAPERMNEYYFPMGWNIATMGDSILITSSHNWARQDWPPGLYIYDISDWNNVQIISSLEGEYCFIDWAPTENQVLVRENGELVWINVENLEEPEEEARFELRDDLILYPPKIFGNNILNADKGGIEVLNIADPENVYRTAYYDLPLDHEDYYNYIWRQMQVVNDTIFASLDAGLNERIDHSTYIFRYWGGADIEPVCYHLPIGWSLISFPHDPFINSVPSMFSEITRHDNLVTVKDYMGRFYRPAFDFNDIPFWDVERGYQILLQRPDSLLLIGETVEPDRPILLPENWSTVSYFPEQRIDAPVAFANITDVIIIVKGGGGGFYIPDWDDFNNMQPLQRGSGYFVKTSEEVELVWNVPEERANYVKDFPELHHFTSFAKTDYFLPILLTSVNLNGLSSHSGDEIGVFTSDDRLIGASVVTDNELTGLSAWRDDPFSGAKDGYTDGETFYFRYWSKQSNKVFEGDSINIFESFSGNNCIEQLPDFITHDLNVITDGENLPFSFELKPNYPNPFNSTTTITYGLSAPCLTRLVLYDLSGREVITLFEGYKQAGFHSANLNAGDLSSGLYFVRLDAGGFSQTRKLVLVR